MFHKINERKPGTKKKKVKGEKVRQETDKSIVSCEDWPGLSGPLSIISSLISVFRTFFLAAAYTQALHLRYTCPAPILSTKLQFGCKLTSGENLLKNQLPSDYD